MLLAKKSKHQSPVAKLAVYLLFLLVLFGSISIYYFYQTGAIDQNNANFLLTATLSLLFPFAAFAYLVLKGTKPQELLDKVGLDTKKLSVKIIVSGLIVFFALFTLELLINLISTITNTTISTNVDTFLQGAPIWFYAFTAIIAPLDEEIFFRGFLVPKLGILPSAILFGVLHAGYNSTFGIEIIAASIFGIIAGYVYKRTNSIYPSLIAHILVNTLALVAIGSI